MERDEGFFQRQAADYDIPEHMHGALVRYILSGIPPGDFLSSVIINNLRFSVLRADHVNIDHLKDFVLYFYWVAPSECHGSIEKMEAWIERGGLRGLPKAQAS